MKVVSGAATHVRRSAAVGGNQYGVSTDQIVTLRLGAQAVQIWMPTPPLIEEGDEIVVAGDIRDGAMHARAYMNRGNGTYGRWAKEGLVGLLFGFVVWMAGAGFLALLLTVFLFQSLGIEHLTRPGMIAALIAVGLFYYTRHITPELKTRKALHLVRTVSP